MHTYRHSRYAFRMAVGTRAAPADAGLPQTPVRARLAAFGLTPTGKIHYS